MTTHKWGWCAVTVSFQVKQRLYSAFLGSTFSSHSHDEKFQSFERVLSKHSFKMTVIYYLTILLSQTHTAQYYELCTEKSLSDTPSLHWLRGFLLPFGLILLHADEEMPESIFTQLFFMAIMGMLLMHLMLNPKSCLSSQSLISLVLSRFLKPEVL